MKRVFKSPHLWIILAIMVCGGTVYYADQIPLLQNFIVHTPFSFARYSTHRILSLIPVAYAAYVFRFYGGLGAVTFISLALLPRPLFISKAPEDIAETVAFFIIGFLVTWLIDRQERTVLHLQNTQQELEHSLGTVKNQSQLLTSYHDISTMIFQTTNINEIASNALKKVTDFTGAEAGWIYLINENRELILTTSMGIPPRFIENPDEKALQTGKLVVVKGNSSDFGFKQLRYKENGIAAIVPLLSKGGIQGTLGILTTEQQCSEELLHMLAGFGTRIGLAVERAKVDQQSKVITEQLRLSEERYRGLFENASEAIFVCSISGRIISVNRAAEEVTGYSWDELSGVILWQLFSGNGRAVVEKLFLGEIENITIGRNEELQLLRKDSKEAFVELRFSPILRNGITAGCQAIARDVTEEKQLHQNMQQYVTQITKAQEAERLRISRELHDETAQVLAGLSRSLDSIISDEKILSRSTVSDLAKLKEMTDSVLSGVRRFSQDLRPSILDHLGLVPALEWLASDLENYGITPTVNVSGSQYRFSSEKELVVFRIAQEALNNIKKHANASAVEMTIDFEADALTMTMRDNGQGFSMPHRVGDLSKSGKLGLIGMRERARLIGGILIVQSELKSGTTVILRIPKSP